MTVTSSVNKQFYTGNGSVTTFAINSLSGDVLTGLTIFDDDDVKVYLDGVLKTKTTHYTISSTTPPASFAGKLVNANVVFLTAPANGVAVAIVRDIPVTQDLLLSNGNNVPPKPLESQLDKIVVQNQQLAGTLVVDVVRIGGFESASGIDPITIENDKYLKWVGGQLTNADPVAIGVDISNATVTQVATNTANITTNTTNITTLLQNGTSPWSSSRTYVAGNVANYTGSLWLCLVGNTNSAPTLFNTNWAMVQSGFDTLTRDAIQGTAPVWASTTTITMGTLNCLDSLRTSLITCSSATLNFATTGLNGLDTGSIASNTWYYIYAILNPTTLATGYLASTSASSPTLPSGFTKFRLLTAVTTLAGSAVLDNVAWFDWGNKHTVQYDNTTTDKSVLVTGNATSFTTVSASAVAPVGATSLFVGIYEGTSNGDRQLYLRRTGSGVSTGRRVHNFYDDNPSFTNAYYVPAEIGLNSSRQFDYRVSGTGVGSTIWATGYTMEV